MKQHDFKTDERGVSEVLGAVLVFGLVLAVLVIIQVSGVPNANAQIEFQHNERVHSDFQELSEDVLAAGSLDTTQATNVESGVRYPVRLFLLNPGPAAGSVLTEAGQFTISNAVAVDTASEADDYWDGSDRAFDTQRVRYNIDYNVYAEQPETVYEYNTLYNQFDGSTVLALDEGSLVDGNRITLFALDGDLTGATVGTRTVELTPRSAPAQTLSIREDGDGPITVTLRTALDASDWERLLEDELAVNGGRITDIVDVPGVGVAIELATGQTYELRLAKLQVSSSGVDVTDEGERYITIASGDDTSIEKANSQQLVAQVRDGFNNPVAGVSVTFQTTSDGVFSNGKGSVPVETDANGLAKATYTGVSDGGKTIEATFDGGGSTEKVVSFDVDVADTSLNDASGDINPGRLQLISSTIDGGPSSKAVVMTFENKGGSAIEVSLMRLNFYFAGPSGAGASIGRTVLSAEIVDASIDGTTVPSVVGVTMTEKGDFESVSGLTIGDGEVLELKLEFDMTGPQTNSGVEETDFYFTTMVFADTDTAVYLATPS